MENIELLAIISFALFGSVGHCIGMCGGFILTYTTAKIKPEQTKLAQSTYHLLYNFGRVSSYTIMGALFGYFGSLWDINPLSRAILFALAGTLMLLMGLSFGGRLKFLPYIEYPISKHNWFKKIFTAQLQAVSAKSFFILGMLNGLVPCGLVYTMLVTATTTESMFLGGFVMFIFGIFTIPALFSFAYIAGIVAQNRFRYVMIQIASIIIIMYGGWTLLKAYNQYEHWQSADKVHMLMPCCTT